MSVLVRLYRIGLNPRIIELRRREEGDPSSHRERKMNQVDTVGAKHRLLTFLMSFSPDCRPAIQLLGRE
jgi:hypothetical protein